MRIMLASIVLVIASVSAKADQFPAAPHVYVEGSAEIHVEPDVLELSLVIEATDRDLAAAKAKVDERTRGLIESCKSLGIEDADLTSANLQIGPAYDYSGQERKFIGTQVRRPIELRLRNLERYAELIRAIVAAKVDQIASTEMSSSKAPKILQDAQHAALADARARAERFAAASGRELGAANSISEFDQRLQERHLLHPNREIGEKRGEYSAYTGSEFREAPEPFEPGTIVATATVYVIYLLE